jgi:aminoglycoside 6-adenylyltransferase
MKIVDRGTDVIDRVKAWAERHPAIRVLILESTRANPRASLDILSDYDFLLVVSDVDPFVNDVQWLSDFGVPLVRFGDQGPELGMETCARLVLYADGTKIDYIIWPVAMLERVLEQPKLPDVLDVGYQVLLDKDGLTQGLLPPTYTAHIPPKPTEPEFLALVEEFWWETIYVAKTLWRDELTQAKYSFDEVMKRQLLIKLLEWRVEIDHDWSLRPGILGKGLKKHLDPETWSAFAATYCGPDLEENWRALFATTDLFRSIAGEVAQALGYTYADDLDRDVTEYLQGVRALER